MNRREFLYGTTALTLPVMAGCDNSDEPIASIDTNYPVSPFGAKSTAEDVTLGLDLTGKTAVVTGCNSGLGYETMRVLAMRGAHVIGTGRNLEKASKACSSVTGKTTPVALELSNFDSIVESADAIAKLSLPVDILVCNAGINTFSDLELVNGVERTFVVNHLGHFVLVNQLMPLIKESEESRVVHVSSKSAYVQAPVVGIDFYNLRGEGAFDYWEAYGRSKLANLLFTYQMDRNLRGSKIAVNAVHPGLVATNFLASNNKSLIARFLNLFMRVGISSEESASKIMNILMSSEFQETRGKYFVNGMIEKSAPQSYSEKDAKQLWMLSNKLAGTDFPVRG